MSVEAPRAKAIFLDAVAEHEPCDWPRFLDGACGGDAELRRRVEGLLQAHATSAGLLDALGADPAATAADPAEPVEPGAVIGPYKLREPIGEGGMGVVYVADQVEPVRRRVALKVIKPGMDSKQVVARFEAERQALAMMDHPNIARVLDGSMTPSGRPYFVMELVRGLPITEYCDQHQLSIRERLELFVLVCRAVQHAHQKGVIHRDLKPSNVLVTVIDGVAVPKVIDFGIAKATGQSLTDRTVYTGFHQFVGTPLYVSPEQAEPWGVDVDTRSDIYSLGVLLYELLTGTTPFDAETLKRAAFDEMRRIIREEEPPRPSTRLSKLGATLTTVSASRKADPRRLGRSLRGELDWVVMKALEKDRRRRYETARDFAADVMRSLGDQPVEARPPSAAYRLRKFARRNRAGLAVASALALPVLALAGGAGFVLSERAAIRASASLALAEADRWDAAGRRPEELEAVKRAEALLSGRLGDAAMVRDVRRRRAALELVVRLEEIRLEAAGHVREDRFDDVAEERRIAEAFRDAGIDAEALRPAEVARRLPVGPLRGDLAAALDHWAWLRRGLRGRADASWRHLLEAARAADPDPWRDRLRLALAAPDLKALREIQSSPPPNRLHPSTAYLLTRIMLQPRVWDDVREAQRRHPDDLWLNLQLADHERKSRPPRPDVAVGYYRAALALRPDSPGVLVNLGVALLDLDRAEEAVSAFERAVRLKPDYASAYFDLGNALRRTGRTREAIAAYREATRLAPEDGDVGVNLASALFDLGEFGEGEVAAREAIRVSPDNAKAWHNLGMILGRSGKPDEAEAAFRESLGLRPDAADTHNSLGALLCDRRADYDGAIVEFRRALELDPGLARAHENLAIALRGKGDLVEALGSFREAIRLGPKLAGPRIGLGETLAGLGRLDEAVAVLEEATRLAPDLARAFTNLGIARSLNGEAEAAAEALRRALDLDPDDGLAHYTLGNLDVARGDLGAARSAFAEAVRCDPGHAEAHCNLGRVLQELGQTREALAELRLGHALGTKSPGWRYPSARWVEECEALIRSAEGPSGGIPSPP